jgi:membrane protease YdiL (CAAX protease family)
VVRVELLVVFVLAALPSLVFGLQGLGEAQQVETDVPWLELLAQFAASLGPALVCWYLLWRDSVARRAGLDRRSPAFLAGWSAVTLVATVVASVVGGMLAYGLGQSFGLDEETNVGDATFTLKYTVTAVLLAAGAGFGEELVWRAYGMARMEQAGWPRAAVVVPSAIWVLLHLYGGVLTLVVVACVGAPLLWIVWYRRSVWPAVIAHAVYNLAVFLLAAAAPTVDGRFAT